VTSVEDRLVAPFYLSMMGINAIRHANANVLQDLVAVGRDTSVEEVVGLLRGTWRPRVMGAWFSLLHDNETVTRAVLQSLRTSSGSLTAPPLTVAAVLLAEHAAHSAMAEYVARDVAQDWGSAAFVTAAIEHLDSRTPINSSRSNDGHDVERMLAIGKAIRANG
jgi:hypothetical protein